MTVKLTAQMLNEIFPDNAVRQAFVAREDIAALSEEEQERRWQKQKQSIGQLFSALDGMNGYIVPLEVG